MLNKLTILGTGTIVPVPGRKCSGYLLDNTDSLILFDCGPGVLGQLADLEIDYTKLRHVIITHFHYDHISDLFALIISLNIRFGGNTSLQITGPRGIAGLLHDAKKFLFTYQDDYRPENLHINEVEPGNFQVEDLSVTAERTQHTGHSLCYRLDDSSGRSFFYSGDTDYNEHIVRLGSHAGIAVVECSHSEHWHDTSGHMTWPGIMRFHEEAQPSLLVLTHFYADFLAEKFHGRPVEGKDIVFANDKDVYRFTR